MSRHPSTDARRPIRTRARPIGRRSFLGATVAAIGCELVREAEAAKVPSSTHHLTQRAHDPGTPEAEAHAATIFAHGVASGDPLAERVMLWTRVSVEPSATPMVEWMVAEDPKLRTIVARGRLRALPARDHTVKVDVPGLEPGTTYFYAFAVDAVRSPIGRTRTLPDVGVERVRLATVSCANYPHGYFNVYAALALRDDLDAVVHLGDYVYEYGRGQQGDRHVVERAHDPAHECTTLDDYRRRHAQYKTDPDLQRMHAQHPVIVLWDDHETANNAWRGGAQNHQHGEGDWGARMAAAIRAYREWLPIRDPLPAEDPRKARRSMRFGDLAELVLVDTRLGGRDHQAEHDDDEHLGDGKRSLLSRADQKWLLDTLDQSQRDGVAWRLLGQQVRMAQLVDDEGRAVDTDAWDGYPGAREKLLAGIERRGIRDLVVLTGDAHQSWASELRRDPFASPPSTALAVELITPAVSSPPPRNPPDLERVLATHPHVRWAEVTRRGYLEVDVTRDRAVARWWLVDDVVAPDERATLAAALAIPRGEAALVRQDDR